MSSQTLSIILAYLLIAFPLFTFALFLIMYRAIMKQLPTKQRKELQEIVRMAVSAVEQMATVSGLAKKQQAIEMVTALLEAFHLPVPDTHILVWMIEAAVLEMNAFKQQATASHATVPTMPSIPGSQLPPSNFFGGGLPSKPVAGTDAS